MGAVDVICAAVYLVTLAGAMFVFVEICRHGTGLAFVERCAGAVASGLVVSASGAGFILLCIND